MRPPDDRNVVALGDEPLTEPPTKEPKPPTSTTFSLSVSIARRYPATLKGTDLYAQSMAIERIEDVDSHHLAAKLQAFANCWAPECFRR